MLHKVPHRFFYKGFFWCTLLAPGVVQASSQAVSRLPAPEAVRCAVAGLRVWASMSPPLPLSCQFVHVMAGRVTRTLFSSAPCFALGYCTPPGRVAPLAFSWDGCLLMCQHFLICWHRHSLWTLAPAHVWHFHPSTEWREECRRFSAWTSCSVCMM